MQGGAGPLDCQGHFQPLFGPETLTHRGHGINRSSQYGQSAQELQQLCSAAALAHRKELASRAKSCSSDIALSNEETTHLRWLCRRKRGVSTLLASDQIMSSGECQFFDRLRVAVDDSSVRRAEDLNIVPAPWGALGGVNPTQGPWLTYKAPSIQEAV